MRWIRIVLVLSVVGLLTPTTTADPIADAVADLDSPTFAAREQAVLRLLELGESALPALQEALASTSAETRRRAAELIQAIEWEVMNQRLLTSPTVHLSFKDTPLVQAVEELKQQTGLPFSLDLGRVTNQDASVTLDTGEVPLWEAIEQFYQATGLVESVTPAQVAQAPDARISGRQRVIIASARIPTAPATTQITLISGDPADAPSSTIVGPVRFRPLTGDEMAAVLPARGAGESGFLLEVSPAPQLSCQSILGVQILRAVDAEGRTVEQSYTNAAVMANHNPYGQVFVQGNGQVLILSDSSISAAPVGDARQIPVLLRTGERDVRTLAEIEGEVCLRVMTGTGPILELPDPQAAVGQTFDREGIVIKVLGLTETESGTVTLRIHVQHDRDMASMMGQQARIWAANANPRGVMVSATGSSGDSGEPQITLRDAEHNELRRVDTSITMQSVQQAFGAPARVTQEMSLIFQRGKDQIGELELIVSGAKSFDMRVPFVLKNVPLP